MQLTPGGGIPSDVIHIDIPTIPENSKEKGPVIVPLPVEIRPKMCRYRIEVWSKDLRGNPKLEFPRMGLKPVLDLDTLGGVGSGRG